MLVWNKTTLFNLIPVRAMLLYILNFAHEIITYKNLYRASFEHGAQGIYKGHLRTKKIMYNGFTE